MVKMISLLISLAFLGGAMGEATMQIFDGGDGLVLGVPHVALQSVTLLAILSLMLNHTMERN